MAAGISQSRNLIGPLTIALSTEVNCLRDLLTIFNPTAMAKEQVCRGKRVAQRYSRRSRRIVIISFSPENGVRFDARCLSLGVEMYSNSEVCIPFYRILSPNFHLNGSIIGVHQQTQKLEHLNCLHNSLWE